MDPPPPSTSFDQSATESVLQSFVPTTNLTLLCNKRLRLLKKINDFIENIVSPIPENALETLRQMFKGYESNFEVIQENIEETVCKYRLVDTEFDNANQQFSNLYCTFLSKCQVSQTPVNANVMSNSVKSNVTLPRLSLPTFNGNLDQWSTFTGMYNALIHENASLSQIEKFQYLKSCLSGYAASIISNLPLNEENYMIAYNQLKTRFSDKRRLCAFYVNEILEFKPVVRSDYESLRSFCDSYSNYIAALKAQEIPNLSEFILLSICLRKLDNRTRIEFENTLKNGVIPDCSELMSFITDKVRKLELINSTQLLASSSLNKNEKYSNNKNKSLGSLITSNEATTNTLSPMNKKPQNPVNCSICASCQHNVYSCPMFSQLSIEEKYDKLKEKKLCFQCLGNHHKRLCKSTKTCRTCDSPKHHTLLHANKTQIVNTPQTVTTSESTPTCNASSTIQDNSTCLLGTANVIVFDCYNQPHVVRAIIDSASEINVMTSNLLNRLHLKSDNHGKRLVGIGSRTASTRGETDIIISSPIEKSVRFHTRAVVLPNITRNQPAHNLSKNDFRQFAHLQLADEDFHISRPVDLLIGAELFLPILSDKPNKYIVGQPGAILTKFGWVIMGKITNNNCNQSHTEIVESSSLITSIEPIHQTLQKFWEVEELQVPAICEDPVKTFCEKLFVETTKRSTSGRYQVALPFKSQSIKLGDNRCSSLKKYLSLEKRMQPDIKQQYDEFMRQYIELGHMSIAIKSSSYVIPHHCVLKPTSSTTRLRVVFNASAPCTDGVVLNEALHTGPNLQNELAHILLNFRANNVVVTSDIKMMYRQIEVRESDRQYQHIFYRPCPDEKVQEYELHTVSYGMASSSYLSQRTMIQLVSDHGEEFPLAANAVRNHTYVDDIVTGASSPQEARLLIQQLNGLMAKGGLELRKWASNVPDVISDLPDDFLENPRVFSDSSESIKVLGFQWNPSSDTFSYAVLPFDGVHTKRSILSYVSKLFDPLGLLSPVIFACKYFLKVLWISNMNWDTQLTEELSKQWKSISDSFVALSSIRIPRLIESVNVTLSLIGFCDASEKGYAACMYLHVATNVEFVSMRLIMSKTRVAPLKTVTIPRLELNGALLLAKLYNYVSTSLSVTVSNVRLYSDAKLVLTWLRTPPHKLKIYVANRVIQILDLTAPEFWFHISTGNNPADPASRGLSPDQLLNHSIWWSGPSSLHVIPDEWPQNKVELIDDLSELKPPNSALATSVLEKSHLLHELEKYSSLHKTVRILAYIRKFTQNCKAKSLQRYKLRSQRTQLATTPTSITALEYRAALNSLAKLNQEFYLFEARQLLLQSKPPPSLLSLSPFLDSAGCIRVGGRLRHSSLSYDSKHPILLPKKCHLSTLICDQTHIDNLHAGPRTTQSIILRRFWIISSRSLVRQRIHLCVRCNRLHSQPRQPVMSDLPSFRTNTADVFSIVGVDFAGPFVTKASPIRGTKTYKGYLALFVCLVVKAVHLEYVSELTTEAFLAALDRFVSRRGLPLHIYSDNGLNFVGAARQLSEVHKFISNNQSEIQTASSNRQIEWHFNPPHAPNFGGIWEAAIKSAKTLLKNIIGESAMTLEEYSTIFARIEAILNSRPLLETSTDPNEEMLTLTPGHFLIGRPLVQVIETPIDETSTVPRRWTRLRQLTQQFWKRWSSEYLKTLIQRTKWQLPSTPIQVGQIVVIKNFNTPPSAWPLGKVEKLHTGRDNVNRVVTLRTASGLITRPINGLVVLPVT